MTNSFRNSLKRITPALLGCLLFAFGAAAQNISLNINIPAAGSLVGDNLSVVVGTTSTYEIRSVTATVVDRATNLVYSMNVGWTGTVSLLGLPRGPQTLVVKAVDFFGNSGQVQLSFVYDRPPVLTVLEPLFETFARPQFRVRATASDDDPVGTVIRVYLFNIRGSTLLATGSTNLDQIVDLSNWDGYSVALEFDATDSAGQTTTIDKQVNVVANPKIAEIDRVEGTIRDLSADRILFTDGKVLKSKSRLSGTETVLVNRPDLNLGTPFLTPRGAIFPAWVSLGGVGDLYEFRDGTLLNLGAFAANLVVRGNYSIWYDGTALILRDLLAGTNVVVSSAAENSDNDLAENGDVVYWGGDPYQTYRYRNGVSTHLASGIYPRTDGLNIAYFRGASYTTLVLFDGINEIMLGTRDPYDFTMPLLRGGWTAYAKPGNGQTQIWTRSPAGVQAQRTFFGMSSFYSDMDANGDLMVIAPDSAGYRLYYLSGGPLPEDFGPWSFGASAFWLQGNWYAFMGPSLVTFVTPSTVTISSPGWTTDRQFCFTVSAGIGRQVITQESTNLLDWVEVSTNQVGGAAAVQVTIPTSWASEKKFYRAMLVQ